MLAADNLAGIERFFDREYHDPANRDPEVTAHLESCLMHLDALTESRRHWHAAIADAESKIQDRKEAIQNLRSAIRIFKKRLADGDPWPGKSDKTLGKE